MYTSHGWVRYIVFTVSLSSWVLTLRLPHLHAYTVNSVNIYNALCNKTSINWKWYLVSNNNVFTKQHSNCTRIKRYLLFRY